MTSRTSGRLSRRRVLALLGLSPVVPFLPSTWGKNAHAQSNGSRRMLVMVSQHGTVRENWYMRRGQEAGSWDYQFDDADPASFSPILNALHPYREHLTVVDGLAMASQIGDGAANQHDGARQHLLTGTKFIEGGQSPGGPSFDQVVAKAVARPDQLSSLELGDPTFPWGSYVALDRGVKAPLERDPAAAFARLFPTGAGGGNNDAMDAKPSLLDFVANEYAQVARSLSQTDREKLQQHHDLLRDLEKRLTAASGASCENANPADFAGYREAWMPEILDAYIPLAALAFGCDRVPVIVLQPPGLDAVDVGAPAEMDVHQDIAHSTEPAALEYMTRYNAIHAERFAKLIDLFSLYGVLDSTVAVWLTELATGSHELTNMPVVMAGSCGGALKTGQYVCYARDVPTVFLAPAEDSPDAQPTGPAHNRLLVTLMQAMGLDVNSYGETSMPARKGGTVDFTGALSELQA